MDDAFGCPPCKHCKHEASYHDDEFGDCGALGMTDTGWGKCECPGYEEGVYPVMPQRRLQ